MDLDHELWVHVNEKRISKLSHCPFPCRHGLSRTRPKAVAQQDQYRRELLVGTDSSTITLNYKRKGSRAAAQLGWMASQTLRGTPHVSDAIFSSYVNLLCLSNPADTSNQSEIRVLEKLITRRLLASD